LNASTIIRFRHILQWGLLPIFLLVLFFGWKYPLLGWVVPCVMALGIVTSFFNGRFACGFLCPRGAFYDRLMPMMSLKRPLPTFLKNNYFRILTLVVLMSVMLLQLLTHPISWASWGRIFWLMCIITTAIGITLGLFFEPRSWCMFCPIGTLSNWIGGHKNPLYMNQASCIRCKRCEKVCPIRIGILEKMQGDHLQDRDCLKCGECIAACTPQALSFHNLHR